MRIARYREHRESAGSRDDPASLGLVDGGMVRPIDAADGGPVLVEMVQRGVFGSLIPAHDAHPRPIESVRLLAPISTPRKIVAVGLNYADHAAEAKVAAPAEPLVFTKFSSAIIGPDDAIEWDRRLTDGVDYEAELGVVIGRTARHVPIERALDHVYAYTCVNDVSARDLQFGDGQWVRGKSLDSFCPIGPWLVTADEIPDPQALAVSCTVSGETLQAGSTADMFFGVAELISRLSRSFTLEPGDLVATGTPPGVGWFRQPRRLLHNGDEVVVEIERIGKLRNAVWVIE